MLKAKKVIILSLLALITIVSLASCSDGPDPTLLPEPVINFKAVKETLGTGVRIDIINLDETKKEFPALPDVNYTITDENGNVLFSKAYNAINEITNPMAILIDDVTTGELP